MKALIIENSFRRDLKLYRKRGVKLDTLEQIITLLRDDQPLSPKHRPHKLQGEWRHVWECHVGPDFLLLYQFDDTTVTLIRLGSHSDLF